MSEQDARKLYAECLQFTRKLSTTGWIDDMAGAVSVTASPTDLFSGETEDRPLVAGLFGGTGAGKSALLNRLAGADIARTGVVRPTSMEITAYLHEDHRIAKLPEGFPVEQFSEHRHSNPAYRNIVWVDMPDFDSEETQNRDQVMQWIPHIDLLLYVVTPERYKDEEGWRLLLENGYRHGWLFVMNQWDRAVEEQFQDFRALLMKAGFADPVIFRTVSNGTEHAQDSTSDLGTFVVNLSERKTVAQLDEMGWLERLRQAHARLQTQIEILRQVELKDTLVSSFSDHWHRAGYAIQANLEIPFKEFSDGFSRKQLGPLKTMLKSLGGPADKETVAPHVASRTEVKTLWDDWSVKRIADSLSQFQLATEDHGVPHNRLKSVTCELLESVTGSIQKELEKGLHEALKRPGSTFQRLTARVLKYLVFLLPLAALAWVGYRIVDGFIAGAEDQSAYVSVNFLINGLMLTGLAWLVPWVLGRLIVPSVPGSVYRGLQSAVTEGLSQSSEKILQELTLISVENKELLTEARQLSMALEATHSRSEILENTELKKVLMAYPALL
ncbi:hypothetical protein AB833_16845 [Chromatiales bacterium (ex Bugula neritina AB1)]|nr:hypothetical protein AB833_16845 [Chromatiales bacterium (ex Bugula neritina AB1)]